MGDKIKIIFSGDFAPVIPVEKISNDHFNDISKFFETADLHITNLESPLTSCQQAIKKTGPSLKANPSSVSLLQQAKVNIACLANNHIFDYGEQGIKDTINICEENNIDTIGIVNRPDNKDRWYIKKIKGKKIGFLNYCEHEYSVREKGLTGACGYSPVDAFYDISALKPMVDWLIVIYHGGNEYYPLPRTDLKKDFHYLADLGADVVIGHHTHVYSGYEIYKKKPLIYSLGNFFFPSEGEPEGWNTGIICQLEMNNETGFKLIPIIQCENNCYVKLPSSEREPYILEHINALSSIISDDNLLAKEWNNYVEESGDGVLKIFLHSGIFEKIALKLNFSREVHYRIFKTRKKALALLNNIRCSSRHEVIKQKLKKI